MPAETEAGTGRDAGGGRGWAGDLRCQTAGESPGQAAGSERDAGGAEAGLGAEPPGTGRDAGDQITGAGGRKINSKESAL